MNPALVHLILQIFKISSQMKELIISVNFSFSTIIKIYTASSFLREPISLSDKIFRA